MWKGYANDLYNNLLLFLLFSKYFNFAGMVQLVFAAPIAQISA
jgi:hypothetical protein